MSEPVGLLLLFFIAVGAGFYLGIRESKRRARRRMASLSKDYVAGINFFLNEQPDKGIDTLLKGLDVGVESLETHLAIGQLFRKRGEFDRAAQLHSYLLEEGEFDRPNQEKIQLELANDYLASGIFDLAEQVLMEMLDQGCLAKDEVTYQLMQLYEQQRDWLSAISMGERLLRQRPHLSVVLAHYCCEEAQQKKTTPDSARRLVQRALQFDSNCVRASVIESELEMAQQRWSNAIAAIKRIWHQNPAFFDEQLSNLRACFIAEDNEDAFISLLAEISANQPSTARILLLTEALKERDGDQAALDFLQQYLRANPSLKGISQVLSLQSQSSVDDDTKAYLASVKALSDQLVNDKPTYQCRRCGFSTPLMQWRCPSCKRWGTIEPLVKE